MSDAVEDSFLSSTGVGIVLNISLAIYANIESTFSWSLYHCKKWISSFIYEFKSPTVVIIVAYFSPDKV